MYSEGGFKEGVFLTVVDELVWWQKYTYGNPPPPQTCSPPELERYHEAKT